MNKENKVKILIAYHKPSVLLKNELYIPIHVGRSVATQKSKDGLLTKKDYKWLMKNLVGDDTGENISLLNRYLCELTALYWAWKNYDKIGNPDYIGLMHYRRHLIFNAKDIKDFKKHRIFDCYKFADFRDLYGKNGCEELDDIYNLISKYDIIHAETIKHTQTVREQFAGLKRVPFCLNPKIFDNVIFRIKRDKPEYVPAMELYLEQKQHYWFNCFIMSKELFFEYADFVFDILLKEHEVINYENYSVSAKRCLGFISERLLGIFITKKVIFDGKTIKHLPLAFIENTDKYQTLYFKKFLNKLKILINKIKRVNFLIKYILVTLD